MFIRYTAQKDDNGMTVKQIIAREFALSSRLLSKLKNTDGIKVNGVPVTVRCILGRGDVITLEASDKSSKNVTPCNIELDVLYEDESILAVNKPSGMPTHPSQGHHKDTLANAVMYRYRNENFTFRAITRLDGDTTGVVLIARNALAAQRLTDMLQNGKIKKEYTAITVGAPKNEEGIIDAPIARSEDSVIKRKVDENGKSAITKYSVITKSHDKSFAQVKAVPITGRTHQIRLHLSHMGTPIYGDFLYGTPIDGVRAYLHCSCLELCHPMTGKLVKIQAPLPEDMSSLLLKFSSDINN